MEPSRRKITVIHLCFVQSFSLYLLPLWIKWRVKNRWIFLSSIERGIIHSLIHLFTYINPLIIWGILRTFFGVGPILKAINCRFRELPLNLSSSTVIVTLPIGFRDEGLTWYLWGVSVNLLSAPFLAHFKRINAAQSEISEGGDGAMAFTGEDWEHPINMRVSLLAPSVAFQTELVSDGGYRHITLHPRRTEKG